MCLGVGSLKGGTIGVNVDSFRAHIGVQYAA